MMNFWTYEEIEKILIQLDAMGQPFKKYQFVQENNQMILLGKGGSAYVFEAKHRKSTESRFAIKVIGFKNTNIDVEDFNKSADIQKNVEAYQNDVVKIYGSTELWLEFDEEDQVTAIFKKKPENSTKRSMHLQFIVMEKITPVIESMNGIELKITPEGLLGNEKEVLKLASPVGMALKRAHDKKILHRDVKLENVFYSEKDKRYKLGDFGIAKKTKNGFADTVAFTKGYVAPEVKKAAESYDNTADIYSFGMMLYVLMNGLKFPESNTYTVNVHAQYQKGYVVPPPESPISEDFYYIITKACMYDPDQRYQSMEEMLIDIEGLVSNKRVAYRKKYVVEPKYASVIFLIAALISWRLDIYKQYQWLTGTFATLAGFLYAQYLLYTMKKDILTTLYYKFHVYWILVFGFYTMIIQIGSQSSETVRKHYFICSKLGIMDSYGFYYKYLSDIISLGNLKRVGMAGMSFFIFWFIREKILMRYRRRNGG